MPWVLPQERNSLPERNVRRTLVGIERGDQLDEARFETRQGLGIEACERLRQDSGQRAGRSSQNLVPGRQDAELNRATVLTVLGRSDQFACDQRLDEVASCGLMHIHGSRQIVDSYPGPGTDDAHRPQLRAPYADLLFDLLKVSLDGIENKSKPAQHPGSGLADLTSGWVASCDIGTSN